MVSGEHKRQNKKVLLLSKKREQGNRMIPRKVHLPKIKNPPPKIDPMVAKRRKILELQGQGYLKLVG